MGFYLPGIGEAIGGALRMQRQNELMQQSQAILKDESKPWAERVALITAAHPELANNPQLQQMAQIGAQADAAKIAKQKADAEQAMREQAERFKGAAAQIPEAQRRAFILANPDAAAAAFPELLKQYQTEVKTGQENATWLERFQMQEQGKNARNAATNAATVQAQQAALEKEYRQGVASGAIDPTTGQVVPFAARQDEAAAREIAKADAKEANKQARAAEAAQAAQSKVDTSIERGIDTLIADFESEGRTGGFGGDAAAREAMRKSLGLALAQRANPGRSPTDADVEVAMSRIPDSGAFTSPSSAVAALKALKKTFKGFAPPPPAGFTVIEE